MAQTSLPLQPPPPCQQPPKLPPCLPFKPYTPPSSSFIKPCLTDPPSMSCHYPSLHPSQSFTSHHRSPHSPLAPPSLFPCSKLPPLNNPLKPADHSRKLPKSTHSPTLAILLTETQVKIPSPPQTRNKEEETKTSTAVASTQKTDDGRWWLATVNANGSGPFQDVRSSFSENYSHERSRDGDSFILGARYSRKAHRSDGSRRFEERRLGFSGGEKFVFFPFVLS
ncbi:hypothetical protein V6N12_034424 [Hibiscus sabdariffa]|uniref:Uncharacterized protein n=1 Tax=Hibiscus sabdariffa TaxID=183260 RepID=A0ABR2DH50_9ROSI